MLNQVDYMGEIGQPSPKKTQNPRGSILNSPSPRALLQTASRTSGNPASPTIPGLGISRRHRGTGIRRFEAEILSALTAVGAVARKARGLRRPRDKKKKKTPPPRV